MAGVVSICSGPCPEEPARISPNAQKNTASVL